MIAYENICIYYRDNERQSFIVQKFILSYIKLNNKNYSTIYHN